MGSHAALFLCLCLMTSQSGAEEREQDALNWMKTMEKSMELIMFTGTPESPYRFVRGLEQRLLDVSLKDHSLSLQTDTIQALAFKLGCNFTGLSLNSESQAWARPRHAMQFPKELTQNACKSRRPRELRLICIYFFTNYFFRDDNKSFLLHNYVFGAQLDNESVNNLREPINISFWHNQSLVL